MVADGERERESALRRIVLSGRYTKQIHVIRSRSAAEEEGGEEQRGADLPEGRREMEGNIGSFYLSKLNWGWEERVDSAVRGRVHRMSALGRGEGVPKKQIT